MMYDINTITLGEFRKMIAEGDDSHFNQIRVTKTGEVFLAQDIVGADNIDDLAFRFETFDPHNDFIGKNASEDDDHVVPMYNALKQNWEDGCPNSYVDDWRIRNYKSYI